MTHGNHPLTPSDFTKHYNRLRQHHAAVSAGPNSKPPLPTRNVNFTTSNTSGKKSHPSVLAGGVATNPKAVSHEKDKADRATEEGVLDSRTRLVLAGLVNRGIIGKLERCISTGKEVRFARRAPLTEGQRVLCRQWRGCRCRQDL